LVEDYNRCRGEPSTTFKAKKPWTKAIVGVIGGLNVSQLEFKPNVGFEHLTGSFEISKSPMVGISLDILSPRFSERFSFHGNAFYFTSKYYSYTLISSDASTKRNYVTIELQQIKIPIVFRYTFPERNFTPYFNIGISSTVHLNSSSDWIQEVESNNVVETFKNEALSIKKNQLGIWGGLGVIRSINNNLNVFVELRYEQTDGVSQNSIQPHADLQSAIANFQVLIGIRTK
jgi:hypothetical protein